MGRMNGLKALILPEVIKEQTVPRGVEKAQCSLPGVFHNNLESQLRPIEHHASRKNHPSSGASCAPPQCCPHFIDNVTKGERFLDKGISSIEDAGLNTGIVGITGHEEHFKVRQVSS